MVTELAKGVYWVGVVDWTLRHFHGYELSTHRGSTYNAYLIVDEKIVLVDTVWGPYADRLIDNIRAIIDPARLDYVVANHSEMDHAGGLPEVMRLAPKATVVVSKRGMDSIPGHFHQPWNFKAVQTSEKLNLGRRELSFIEAPMLHWPDSMFSYLSPDAILMPNDAFGQHYATTFRYNDQVDAGELYQEALKYYANILTPYSPQVAKKIQEVLALGLPVNMIAPSHGVIWRKDPLQIVKKYQEWAAQTPQPKAVIIYDSMWGATRRLAEAAGEGLAAAGVPFRMFYIPTSDRNDVIAEVFQAGAVIVGSPTFNNGILPSMMPVLEDLRGLRFQNKVAAVVGRYGWSGEAVRLLEEHLTRCQFNVVAGAVSAKWQPKEDDLARCRELGTAVAKALGK